MNLHRIAVATGFALFAAVIFFFDPYQQVRPVGDSSEPFFVQAGEPSRSLLPPLDVSPGEQYRVTCRAVWRKIERDPKTSWKTARVIFASFNELGRWVPAKHGVCAVNRSGAMRFTQVFAIPDGATKVRFELQHLGVAGRIGVESFSVEQVVLRRATRWVFSGLIGLWFFLAAWTAKELRLFRREWGRAVLLAAVLIAVGMLLPGRLLGDARSQVADWVRPDATPIAPSPTAVHSPGSVAVPIAPVPPSTLQVARQRVESLIRRVEPHFWGHLSFFFFLGVMCGKCFWVSSRARGRILRVLLGCLLYAVASELLQVTALSRSVRAGDIALNLIGCGLGLLVSGGWRRQGRGI